MAALEISAGELQAVLSQDPGPTITGSQAAVAVICRAGPEGTELLFIQRATHVHDRWSGQMAFPGGRLDPIDADSHQAAERETLEEVGVDLSEAQRLGSLSSLDGGRARSNLLAVHAHGYWLEGDRPALVNNYEVADSLWVPLAVLADRERGIDYYYPVTRSSWPGIQLDNPDQVVWGLTLRFLADLFSRLDIPLATGPLG